MISEHAKLLITQNNDIKEKDEGRKLLKPKEECVRLQKGDVRDLKRL